MRYGNDDQISWLPELEAYGMEWADVYFGLRGGSNLFEHADIPANVLSSNQRVQGRVSTLRWQKTRWCLARVPNALFAQQAETNLETMMNMFFDACLIDYHQASTQWQAQADKLNGSNQVHITGKNTDLRFSVEGRKWMVFDGRINMPDGEIFTAPVNETLEGYISFEFPGVLGGRLMHDIYLEWRAGKLFKASASTHQDYLFEILNTDQGASLLGEFAFGLNPHITQFSKDILLDEKMGGTIHIALGRAYTECGGTNQSAIHWDIVKDLRREGAVYIDGTKVLEQGHWYL
jgi:aminopeptidase